MTLQKPIRTNGKEPHGEVTDETVASIKLERIARQTLVVPIVGTAPLIVHRFDEKARQQMLDGQQTKTRKKKDPKDPHADYMRSRYLIDDTADGFPAVGFKAAIVDSARLFDGVKMTELKAALYVLGDGLERLVRIETPQMPPRMREDPVRVGMGTADLRYRAEYWPWTAALQIVFVPSMISAQSVVAIVDAAGMGGIGEWRPSRAKTGIYGTFEVQG